MIYRDRKINDGDSDCFLGRRDTAAGVNIWSRKDVVVVVVVDGHHDHQHDKAEERQSTGG